MLKDVEEGANLAARIGRRLKPPLAEDGSVMAWRWFVVVMITLNSVGLALHVVLACGLTPMFSGFAYASEQKSQAAALLTSRAEQLGWRIFDLRVQQCSAIKKGSSAQLYTVQLQELTKVYKEVTNQYSQVPRCEELE